jgi:hypothetical protein
VISKIVKLVTGLLFSLLLLALLSYKLLDVPMGLTVDETAFGYNATLLSHSGRDENGRFLPLFVLSINGQDWRQPVTQYYLTFLFKLFGPSVYLLRFSSVLITLFSSLFLFYFAKKIKGELFALSGVVIFITTPLIMIQSHMGLDNIMPIPFTLFWLFCIYQYGQTRQLKYIALSGISLGISFYTYKGMRAVVPVWGAMSIIYFYFLKINPIKSISIFIAFIAPFALAVPYLHHLYPGAIFGGARPKTESVYDFLYPYLSSFDPTFLYIKGDATPFHSTGRHGMMLLSTLPVFIYGIFSSYKSKNHFYWFTLLSFFSAPLLYGFVDSVHRASRLMCLIPPYSLICALGLIEILKSKHHLKKLIVAFSFTLISINYYDFVKFYWNDYAKFTQNFLGDLKPYLSFRELKIESEKLGLKPYISDDISSQFFESIYFPGGLEKIHRDLLPPKNSILMTNRENIPGMNRIDTKLIYHHLQTN